MKCYLPILFLLASLATYSQEPEAEKLTQLIKPKSVLNDYLNFDVGKIMIGSGGANKTFPNSPNFSMRVQLLCPFAFSKRHLKIAYGLTYGGSKIRAPHTRLQFTNDDWTSIQQNDNYEYTQLRIRSLGLIAMRVIRLGSFTTMIGPSFDFNLSTKVKEKSKGSDVVSYLLNKSVHKLVVPLNIQVSISKKQFFAFGFFGRYTLSPVFKDPPFKKIKQYVVGLSGSIIL